MFITVTLTHLPATSAWNVAEEGGCRREEHSLNISRDAVITPPECLIGSVPADGGGALITADVSTGIRRRLMAGRAAKAPLPEEDVGGSDPEQKVSSAPVSI